MSIKIIISSISILLLIAPSVFSDIVINEVFYDPAGTDGVALNKEFVELYNNGSDPVNISLYKIRMAGSWWQTAYQIPPRTIIPAYSHLLIAEGETFSVTPDLLGSLGLPNGNYQAYYDNGWHSFTGPVDGVRLIDADGQVLDCLLYNPTPCGNQNNLDTTGADPVEFYEDVPSGFSISRVIAGVDNDLLSDWETLTYPSPQVRGPLADSDGDGIPDIVENMIGSDPYASDSDSDGLEDSQELKNWNFTIDPNETDPTDPDTDGDGLWDGVEINTYYSQPRVADTDGDSLLDGAEVYDYDTSPTKQDTDVDGYRDDREIQYGTDPTDPSSRPAIVINEVYYDAPGSDNRKEFIILFNPELYDVNISGFRIASAGTSFTRNLSFPEGSVIPSCCFYLIGEEDAVDINGNPPDLISWLELQNGDQNDPDAYYYGSESPTDGVRLTGPWLDRGKVDLDTVLWDSPNDNNLRGDAHDPAQSDEFIPDVQPGWSLRRKTAGCDTNHKSDWIEVIPKRVSSALGTDPDFDGLSTWEEINIYYTDPCNPDSDLDGLSDDDEVWHGYDPNDENSVPSSVPEANKKKFFIRGGDFNGDGTPDITIFRPENGLWAIKDITRLYFGQNGDIPVPGNYDGSGPTDICIFRPSNGLWAVRDLTQVYYGNSEDLPVPRDYDGDHTCDIGIFRPLTGLWGIRGITNCYFGESGDAAIPADYNGTTAGRANIAIFRPSNGLWAIRGTTQVYFGQSLDMPVPENYSGTGQADIAIFRGKTGLWSIRTFSRLYYGELADIPAPADYDQGNSQSEIAVFRPSFGLWAIRNFSQTYYGQSNDMPLPLYYRAMDSDCDGLPDWWEDKFWPNDLSQIPFGDYDADGLNNLGEYKYHTDPTEFDTDNDGITDGDEVNNSTDPLNPDTTPPIIKITSHFNGQTIVNN